MPNEKNKGYISVRLPEDAGIKDTGTLKVYVLNDNDELIQEASFKGAEAQLKADASSLPEHSRMFIAPEAPKELSTQKINARYLAKTRAFEVPMLIKDNVLNIARLPMDFGIFHPWHWCRITGHVNKNFIIDGRVVNLPVCNVRVRIYEVDRCRLWLRIPDYVFIDISHKLRRIIDEQGRPFPPIPPVGPGPIEKLNLPLRMLRKDAKLQESLKIKALPKLSQDVQAGLLSGSANTVKEVVLRNFASLHPYLCLWPGIWPWFYCLYEIATVPTDCNGKFEEWYPVIGQDQPDIYIEVQSGIGGTWTNVHSPSIPCNTWWNYACGSEINITVTDSRVGPCACEPLPGSIVWIRWVGSTSLRSIAMNAADASTPSPFSDVRGLTNRTGIEGLNYVSPFSQQFPFVIQFGDGFPSGSITHFRWKYHRIANADLAPVTETLQYQDHALSRQYVYEAIGASGRLERFTNEHPLYTGSGNLYKIPKSDASLETGVTGAQWSHQDMTSMLVNTIGAGTPNMQNGLYEFVMELCDSGGNVQQVGDEVFHVNKLDTLSSTAAIRVDPNYLVRETAVSPVTGFRFLLRIDNDPTTCDILNAIVRNLSDDTYSTTDTECGFAEFKDRKNGLMLLRFEADQPHRYARYTFDVYKGNSSPTPILTATGQVPPPAAGPAVVNGVSTPFQLQPTLDSLLGPCTRAAFAEHLKVEAYHTDGTYSLSGYDSEDTAAFAIQQVTA